MAGKQDLERGKKGKCSQNVLNIFVVAVKRVRHWTRDRDTDANLDLDSL